MSDNLKRFVDDDDAPLERSLVRAGRDAGMPLAEREHIWSSIFAQLPPAGGSGGEGGAGPQMTPGRRGAPPTSAPPGGHGTRPEAVMRSPASASSLAPASKASSWSAALSKAVALPAVKAASVVSAATLSAAFAYSIARAPAARSGYAAGGGGGAGFGIVRPPPSVGGALGGPSLLASNDASPAPSASLSARAPGDERRSPPARRADVALAADVAPSFPGATVEANPPSFATPNSNDPLGDAAAASPKAVTDVPAASAEAAPAATVEARVESRLREESALVRHARDLLRAGNATAALASLDAGAASFAGGALSQEREALAIQALARSGRRDVASKRARAFLSAYPGSAHAEDVRAYIVEAQR